MMSRKQSEVAVEISRISNHNYSRKIKPFNFQQNTPFDDDIPKPGPTFNRATSRVEGQCYRVIVMKERIQCIYTKDGPNRTQTPTRRTDDRTSKYSVATSYIIDLNPKSTILSTSLLTPFLLGPISMLNLLFNQ